MSLQLTKTEAPGRALQRTCRRHVEQALAGLQKAHQPEGVHEVRKEIKRLRAIFRLTRGSLNRSEHRKTAKIMRLAAKPLAASRDARVTQKAFATLVGGKARRFPNLQAALEAYCRHAERSFKDQESAALAQFILKKAGRRLDEGKLKQAGWTEIKAWLNRSYTRGRDACKLARRKPAPDHIHEWRKQVKNLWFQLDFLCPRWPGRTKALLDGLEQLGEQLGDEHDLLLLEQFAREHRGYRQETEALQHLIDSKRRLFVGRVLKLGSRLYAKTPAAVCAQLEQDWQSWRGGH